MLSYSLKNATASAWSWNEFFYTMNVNDMTPQILVLRRHKPYARITYNKLVIINWKTRTKKEIALAVTHPEKKVICDGHPEKKVIFDTVRFH